MAPEVFTRVGGRSAVVRQPEEGGGEERRALEALVSCPVGAIGAPGLEHDAVRVGRRFPLPVADGVFHCGFHSRRSFGGAAYLIRRAGGNVLVDSPRFSKQLVESVREMGGVRYLFLTHRDDVADHAEWQREFGCERILHSADIEAETQDVERRLRGGSPFLLIPKSDELIAIPVPGHTAGQVVLLYQQRFLFSGDHLMWLPALGHLGAFRQLCWYSWRTQIESQRSLLAYRFEWVLPAHGRRFRASAERMREEVKRCIRWMEGVS